jgi:hypothetical protein
MSWVTFTIAMLLSAFFLVIFFRIIREILMINAWVDKRRAMNKFSSAHWAVGPLFRPE